MLTMQGPQVQSLLRELGPPARNELTQVSAKTEDPVSCDKNRVQTNEYFFKLEK